MSAPKISAAGGRIQVYAAERAPSNGASGVRIIPLSMYRAVAGQVLLKKAVAGLPES